MDISTFEPFPKNPPISKVFREVGLADALGSGMRNTFKYTRMYSGGEPDFYEGDIFRTVIPLTEAATATVGPVSSVNYNSGGSDGVSDGVKFIKLSNEKLNSLLEYCCTERTRKEMMEWCSIKSDSYFRINILKPLLSVGLLKMTVPDKPNSSKQKYIKA